MKFHLVKIRISPPEQLEFEFMSDGYLVWAGGDTKEEAMESVFKNTGSRRDLQFTYIRPTQIIKRR